MESVSVRLFTSALEPIMWAYGEDLNSALQSFRLVVFEAVAQRLSFTQAAEILHVSQPAITSHIKALEDDLNVRVFERRNGKVTITPAGKVLQTYTKELHCLSEDVLRKIGSLQGEERGKTGHWCFPRRSHNMCCRGSLPSFFGYILA